MRRKTLTVKVIELLIITMIFLLILLLGTSYMFYQKSKTEFKEKKEYAVNICVQNIKEHLNNAETQVIDLMLNTLDETDLNSTDDLIRYWAKNRINTSIKNKISANSDVDYFFVKNRDTLMIKGYSTSLSAVSRKRIMKYFKRKLPLEAFKTRSNNWIIKKIDGEAYFYLAYEMKDYVVGALIRVSTFDNALAIILNRDVDNYSYFVDGQTYYHYQSQAKSTDTNGLPFGLDRIANERVIIRTAIPSSDLAFVSDFKIETLKLFLNNTYIILAGMVAIFMAMLFILKRIISRLIMNPINQLLAGMQQAAKGRLDSYIPVDAGSIEFNELNSSYNRMLREITDLQISKYEQQIKDSERKIKLLRMQIKPHFYLNAITTIRSMTYQDRVEDIRTYLDALSEHIRYMLRVNSSEVKLEEELSHIENYLKMQGIKFPNSVAYYIGCPQELRNKDIGHLLLFTVIENAFKFAMNLYDTLILLIQCDVVEEEGFSGYRIIVEDNGNGFSQEQIVKFRIGNEVEEKQDGKHIGLSNIKKTLELQYGRDDLLRLSNIEPHGARVEIWIPDEKRMAMEGV